MKRYLLIAATLLSLSVAAQKADYLTLRTTDGTESSLSLSEGIRITFDNGQIKVVAGSKTFVRPLTEMSRMWLSATPTVINDIHSNDGFAEGSLVSVYTLDGRLAATFTQSKGNEPQLPEGIYIFKSSDKTIKKIIAP